VLRLMKSVEPVKTKVAYTVLEWNVTSNAVGGLYKL